MRIAINCRSFLKKQYTGIGRYAYHLVKSLSEIDRENEYHLYARKGLFSFNKRVPRFTARNFITHVDWFGRGLAKQITNIDICHIPSPGPLGIPDGAKLIVTVHDVIFKAFPEGHTKETIEAGEQQFRQIRDKASKIICCSQNTVNDLKKYFHVPDEKIVRIYQGVDKEIFYRITEEEDQSGKTILEQKEIEGPFILSVGTIEPRKNLINSIHAFHSLKIRKLFSGKLAVVGMKGWMHEDLVSLIEELGLTDHIVFLGYLSDRELRYLYNKAEVFIFPSFYEGFGFPILEAFCCGAPVVTSNASSCAEVAGEAALTVDPGNPDDISDAMGRIVSDNELRNTLREKGFKRAQDFDFRKTAEETLRVYREVHGS